MLAEPMALPTDMAFGDLERILVDLGWTIRDMGKSHVIVRKSRHRVKRVYLRLIRKEIEASAD